MQPIDYAQIGIIDIDNMTREDVVTNGILPILGLDGHSWSIEAGNLEMHYINPDLAEDILDESIKELTDIGYTHQYDEDTEILILFQPNN